MRIGNTELQPLTKNLLFINIILFVATYVFGFRFNIDLGEFLAGRFFLLQDFQPWQIITHMFMHGSTMHLFFNMFGLFMFGNFLERVLGTKKYAFLYFISGFGAFLLHTLNQYVNYVELQSWVEQALSIKSDFPTAAYLINLSNDGINEYLRQTNGSISQGMVSNLENILPQVVGASGCIYGLLAAFAYLFPNTELMLLFIPFPIKAKYFVPIIVGIDLFLGVNPIQGNNIAHFAHVGGALFGLLLVIFWNKYNKRDFY